MTMQLCPCGSGLPFATCCEPFLTSATLPTTPEQLMRSRYTAFHQGAVDYLLATHHPSQRQPDERGALVASIEATEWLSLRVLQTTQPTKDGRGMVEFVAFYRTQEQLGQLHERSTFVRERGRWYYDAGVQLGPIPLGRNDLCWCGSGKKVKHCHGC